MKVGGRSGAAVTELVGLYRTSPEPSSASPDESMSPLPKEVTIHSYNKTIKQ